MLDQKLFGELEAFILKARKESGYGSTEIGENHADGSRTVEYCSGDGKWFYIRRCYGHNRCCTIETVGYLGEVVWVMTHFGWFVDKSAEIGPLPSFLVAALIFGRRNEVREGFLPIRGPKEFVNPSSGLMYLCQCDGDITRFNGKEEITHTIPDESDSLPPYFGQFSGGLVG